MHGGLASCLCRHVFDGGLRLLVRDARVARLLVVFALDKRRKKALQEYKI